MSKVVQAYQPPYANDSSHNSNDGLSLLHLSASRLEDLKLIQEEELLFGFDLRSYWFAFFKKIVHRRLGRRQILTSSDSKVSGYASRIRCVSVDDSRLRKEKFPDTKVSGLVWTGPETPWEPTKFTVHWSQSQWPKFGKGKPYYNLILNMNALSEVKVMVLF